jgi:hypothetical protein
MRLRDLLANHLRRAVRGAGLLPVMLFALCGGCAEKPVEKSPQDIEKSRQEHIEMMHREAGQAPAKQ